MQHISACFGTVSTFHGQRRSCERETQGYVKGSLQNDGKRWRGYAPLRDRSHSAYLFVNHSDHLSATALPGPLDGPAFSISSKARTECAYAAPARISAATHIASIKSSRVALSRMAALV